VIVLKKCRLEFGNVPDSAFPRKNQKIGQNSRLPTWREMNWDTSPEAEAVLFRLWRETPAWRKLEMMDSLNQGARQLALIGLRKRFPDASPAELQRRLATILLGERDGRPGLRPTLFLKENNLANSEALQVTLQVTSALDELGISYVIGGSLASIIHGMLRTTMDVDIVADLLSDQVTPFVNQLQETFYIDETAVRQAGDA
jgi:hypothetical protein